MKRIINILLAVYIGFAACYPCNDRDVCADDENEKHVASIHDESSQQKDFCSPLCICSCCRSTINKSPDFSFVIYFPKIREFNFTFKPLDIKMVSHSIWQPPRL